MGGDDAFDEDVGDTWDPRTSRTSNTTEDHEDAGLTDRSTTTLGWLDRIRSAFLPSPRPTRTTKPTQTAPRTTGTSPKTGDLPQGSDREAGRAGAATLVRRRRCSVLFGVLIYVLDTNNKNFRLQKGQITPQTTLVLGIALAVLLVAATLYGRRAPVGFVALFVFLMFGTTSFFLGAPFLALAAWLLYRSYKIQRDSAATARAARPEQSASPASTTRSGPATNKSAKSASKRSRTKGPAMPEANKRYTPKRPPPPAPKPSRRERKAAQSSD